jgi:hypothetical protein
MKKLSLLSFFGLLAAAVSVPALADINNSDIYIINNTDHTIEVGAQTQEEHAKSMGKEVSKVVALTQKRHIQGDALVVKPHERKKVISLGRDQTIKRNYASPLVLTGVPVVAGAVTALVSYARIIEFVIDGQKHTFESQAKPSANFSTLTYNGKKLPVRLDGLEIRPAKFKFGKLYRDVEMVFDPNIKP